MFVQIKQKTQFNNFKKKTIRTAKTQPKLNRSNHAPFPAKAQKGPTKVQKEQHEWTRKCFLLFAAARWCQSVRWNVFSSVAQIWRELVAGDFWKRAKEVRIKGRSLIRER
jgi:hypothetical protein